MTTDHTTRLALKTLLALTLAWAGAASAVPVAQLDILGGSYDAADESVVTNDSTFSLYGYGNTGSSGGTAVNTSLYWYVSIAVTPKVSAAAASSTNIGSFTVDGTTYDNSDFVYGTPPLESLMNYQPFDLQQHGIFDTLYTTLAVTWDSTQTRSTVNVQNTPGTDPLANPGSDLMTVGWDFDISNLTAGFNLHFDLFGVDCSDSKFDATHCAVMQFAPFSHDAATTSVPEPEVLTLLGFGLLIIGAAGRRRRPV